MPTDLSTIDPTTLQPGPSTDALVAELLGWKKSKPPSYVDKQCQRWITPDGDLRYIGGCFIYANSFRPSRDPDHAGELRRAAVDFTLYYMPKLASVGCYIWHDEDGKASHSAASLEETNGDKAAAEALAVTRAFVAAMIAEQEKK
jgi:hypothetical protein